MPNEQRELRVRKVNEKGQPIQGAVFALFGSVDDAADSTNAQAYGITDANGELIFCASSEVDRGYMNWDANTAAVYWLKEITAPTGYELNKNLIRIEVDNTGIYANATGVDPESGDYVDNNGIAVEASLGGLTQTLVKYAEGIVDETLMYITATEQTADGTDEELSWVDSAKSESAVYDKINGYDLKPFTAKDGYIRAMPRQTENISEPPAAKRDDLKKDGKPIDLDGLFSLVNTVVVTDQPLPGHVPSNPNEPDEPNDSSEPDKSDNNPHTGFDSRSIFWATALTLSMIVAVHPQRKHRKSKK